MAKSMKMNDADMDGATSFSHFKPIRKSGENAHTPASKDVMGGSEREWKKIGPDRTSPDAQKRKVTKPNLPMLPKGGTKSHPNLSTRKSSATPAYGPDTDMIGQPQSGNMTLGPADLGGAHKKWHKKGYDMDVPSTLGSDAPRLKKKWEAR